MLFNMHHLSSMDTVNEEQKKQEFKYALGCYAHFNALIKQPLFLSNITWKYKLNIQYRCCLFSCLMCTIFGFDAHL